MPSGCVRYLPEASAFRMRRVPFRHSFHGVPESDHRFHPPISTQTNSPNPILWVPRPRHPHTSHFSCRCVSPLRVVRVAALTQFSDRSPGASARRHSRRSLARPNLGGERRQRRSLFGAAGADANPPFTLFTTKQDRIYCALLLRRE